VISALELPRLVDSTRTVVMLMLMLMVMVIVILMLMLMIVNGDGTGHGHGHGYGENDESDKHYGDDRIMFVMVVESMDVMEMIIEKFVNVPEKVEVAPLEHRLGCGNVPLASKEQYKGVNAQQVKKEFDI
jgi:hypothetical protein